jgi:hypothetical protein
LKNIFGIPENRVNQLKKDKERGVLVLENLSQDERDALHYETTPENLAYWKSERAEACASGCIRRWRRCDEGCRLMLLELAPATTDEHMLYDNVLGSLLTEFDDLPREH